MRPLKVFRYNATFAGCGEKLVQIMDQSFCAREWILTGIGTIILLVNIR